MVYIKLIIRENSCRSRMKYPAQLENGKGEDKLPLQRLYKNGLKRRMNADDIAGYWTDLFRTLE